MCNNPSTQTPQQGFMAFLWAPPPQNLQQKLGDFFLASRWWSFRSCHSSIDRWWIGLGSFEELSWPFLDTKTMGVGRSIGGNGIMTWSFGCQKFLCVSTFRLAWPPDRPVDYCWGTFFWKHQILQKSRRKNTDEMKQFLTRDSGPSIVRETVWQVQARCQMDDGIHQAWCCVHRRSMLQQEPTSSAVFEVQPVLTIDTKTLISKIKRCISIAKMKFLLFGGKHMKFVVLWRHTQWYPNPVCKA